MTIAISLKLDEEYFNEVEKNIPELKVSRNKYINDAVRTYNVMIKKQKIKKMTEDASYAVRENGMEVLKEFKALKADYEKY